MSDTAVRTHVRENGSLLAASERRVLLWLATRLPGWVTSDQLTALALAAMLGSGLAYWTASLNPAGLLLVVVGLAVNWFGDSLDGTLARVRNQQRPRYGYYVDHVVDLIGACALLGGLGLSGYMSPLVAMGLLAAYLLVSAEVYLATHACGVFRLSTWRFGPTELRILLAAGTLALLAKPTVTLMGQPYRLFDVGGVAAIGAMTAVLLWSAARNTAALYRAEPLPARERPAAAQTPAPPIAA
ncbi:MAG: CDP-alcohol phosphatidyltransferase family protein [Acidobacteria bacterium]|nr:CDP-alcohol phosphatidyltransferase family protein [Acidobacteriota bacterium]